MHTAANPQLSFFFVFFFFTGNSAVTLPNCGLVELCSVAKVQKFAVGPLFQANESTPGEFNLKRWVLGGKNPS